jgi:hypothetical protein
MFVVSFGGMSKLVLLDWWRGPRPYYTLKLKACQRLIVGPNYSGSRRLVVTHGAEPLRHGHLNQFLKVVG